MRQYMIQHLLGLIAGGCIAGQAIAAQYTFEFGGTVQFVLPPLPAELSAVTVGTPYTMTFTFDSNATNESPFPDLGHYLNAVSSMEVKIAGATLVPTFLSGIEVTNNWVNGDGEDVYTVAGTVGNPANLDSLTIGITLSDSTGSVFHSIALPTTLNLDDFDGGFGIDGFGIGNAFFTIAADITSFSATMVGTPIPGDLDGDSDVDDADFGIAFAAFTGPGNGPPGNPAADLDGDNDVDDADFGLAFAAFTGPGGAAGVPEPSALALIGLGGLLAIRRR